MIEARPDVTQAARVCDDGSVNPLVSYWHADLDGTVHATQLVNQQHYAASTMKLPVALAAHRLADAGVLDLDEPVTVHTEFASAVPGERFTMSETEDEELRTWEEVGAPVPLRELVRRSLVRSGNLAANLVLERVGLDAVGSVLADAGCSPMTQVVRGIEDLPARDAGLENLVTAHDLARILTGLATGRLATPSTCTELERILGEQHYRDGIPLGLPSGTPVANKTGWTSQVQHDAAIVRPPDRPPFVLVILTSGLPEDEAEARIMDVAAYLWDTMPVRPLGGAS